jgi:hypothetical protein
MIIAKKFIASEILSKRGRGRVEWFVRNGCERPSYMKKAMRRKRLMLISAVYLIPEDLSSSSPFFSCSSLPAILSSPLFTGKTRV